MKVTFLVGAENNLPQFYCLAKGLSLDFDIQFIDLRIGGITEKVISKGFPCTEFIVDSIQSGNKLGLKKRLQDADKLVTQYPSDIYVIPYEFHFFYFVTKLAQNSGKKVVHIQHALWGLGKFRSEFYKRPNQIADPIKPKPVMRSLKSRVKKLLLPNKNPVSTNAELEPKLQKYWEAFQNLNDDERCYPLNADVFLVPNKWYKQQVETERSNYPNERVCISGILKETVFESKYSRALLAEKFGLDSRKKWVIYLFAEFEQFPERYSLLTPSIQGCQDFIDSFEQRLDVERIILIHPSTKQSEDILLRMTQNRGTAVVLTDEHFDFYRQAEVVAGVKSTALLEAAAMGKPVVRQMYVLDGLYDHIQYNSDSIYFRSTSLEFKRTVNSFVDNSKPHTLYCNQMKLKEEFFVPFKSKEVCSVFKELLV